MSMPNTEGEVVGFFHAGITVTDMDRSVPFYRDGLGLEPFWDVTRDSEMVRTVVGVRFTTLRNVMLRVPGGGFVELLEYRGVDRSDPSFAPASEPGTGHLCLEVRGIDALVTRLVTLGGSAGSEVQTVAQGGSRAGSKLVYVRDPDGWLVELYQFASGSSADLRAEA
jgi:catechol 2,3-dioxygenase-like lactoylglutathione lyase family enzyme